MEDFYVPSLFREEKNKTVFNNYTCYCKKITVMGKSRKPWDSKPNKLEIE
jgi:hypothetical protein